MLRSPYVKDIYDQDSARRSHQVESDGYLGSAGKNPHSDSSEKVGSAALPVLQPSSSFLDIQDQDANYKNAKILASGKKLKGGKVVPNHISDVLSAARREKDYPGKQLKLKGKNKSPSVTSRITKPMKAKEDYENMETGQRGRNITESPRFGKSGRGVANDRRRAGSINEQYNVLEKPKEHAVHNRSIEPTKKMQVSPLINNGKIRKRNKSKG